MTIRQHSRLHPKRVVVVGGGVAGLETMLALRHLAGDRVQIEVLAPETTFHYRPLDVAQPFGRGGVRVLDLEELVRSGGGRRRVGSLVAVDPDRKVARTAANEEVTYDALVICTGARALPAVDGALTFRGQPDLPAFNELLSKVGRQQDTLAFVLPPGASWALPMYELAFLTAGELARAGRTLTDLVIVTHEHKPLTMFGSEVSDAVEVLLERDGIGIETGVEVIGYRNDILWLAPKGELHVDHVVAMPRLRGPAIRGLPHDADGFLPTDSFGRVEGVEDVYAAGDATSRPIKQGGLASQQADAAASSIAAWAGAPVRPIPYEPVLRGQLLTLGASRYLEIDLGDPSHTTKIGFHPSSAPSEKIVSQYLTPFLGERGIGEHRIETL